MIKLKRKYCVYWFTFISLVIMVKSVSIHSVYCQSSWEWVQPLPTGNMLYSVHHSNSNIKFAAGSMGTIIKTSNSGLNWIPLSSGTSKDIFEIYCIKENFVIAIGKSGLILRSTDGGDSWTEISCNENSDLHDIIFVNKFIGYTAGLNGTILKTTDGSKSWRRLQTGSNDPFFVISFLNENSGVAGGYKAVMKTSDGGKTWTKLNLSQLNNAVKGICYADVDVIYAVSDSPHGTFYRTTNDGLIWTVNSLNLPYLYDGSVDLVRSMSFANVHIGFITTNSRTILKTTNAGASWELDSTFRSLSKNLSMEDVHAGRIGNVNIAGSGGTILSSTNSGANWYPQSGNMNSITSGYFTDQYTGYCAGESGAIQKTIDGGQSWFYLKPFTNKFINSIFFVNEKTGFAAGERGTTFKTLNGGSEWINQTHYTNLDFKAVCFVNKDEGFAAGGNPENERAFIYKTDNGGTNWFEVFDSLSMGVFNAITFVNMNEGFVIGDNGNILRTTNRGATWTSQNLLYKNLNSISFLNSLKGIISADDGIVLRTEDGGNIWKIQLTGSYQNLNSVKFVNDNLVIAAGENGVITKSEDGGMSWNREKDVTSNNLNSVSSNNYIYLFGDHGTILRRKEFENPIISNDKLTSSGFILHQNYPNPFNPVTMINFKLNKNARVSLKIYDINGKEIHTLVNSNLNAGKYSEQFSGIGWSSGIYFYELKVNGVSEVRRMILLK